MAGVYDCHAVTFFSWFVFVFVFVFSFSCSFLVLWEYFPFYFLLIECMLCLRCFLQCGVLVTQNCDA
mgnify:CR=1 FL=1